MDNDDGREVFGRLLQAVTSRPILSTYDGKAPVDQFLAELAVIHDDLREDDEICLRVLRQALDGDAKSFFTQMLLADQREQKTATLDEWKERLLKRYTKPYSVQLSELRSRKMRASETACEYVDAVVNLANSMTPPLNDEQLSILLYDNCLPRYKKSLLSMEPHTPDEFMVKLGRLMSVDEDEETLVEKLTKLLEKTKTEEKKELATTLAVQQAPMQRQDNDGYRQSSSGGDNWQNFRSNSNFRCRRRGRRNWGRGRNWNGNKNSQQHQTQQFNPMGVVYGYQQPPVAFMPPGMSFQQPQWQQQWQPQQLALMPDAVPPANAQYAGQSHAPSRQNVPQQQRTYVVETPSPSAPSADQEVAALFASHPGNC